MTEEKKLEAPKEVVTIPIGPDGKVMARTNQEVLRYCNALVTGGGVPDRFDSPQKLFAALMTVRDLGLPDTAIRQVANIHGTPSIFGDLPLALVQRTGKLTEFREFWFDKNYTQICFENKNLKAEVYGAVVFMSREKGPVQSFAYTVDDARENGLLTESTNPLKPWKKYTKLMLRYKARAIGLKSLFADAINGVSIMEYDYDERGEEDMKDVTSPAKALEEHIGGLQ